MGSAACSACSEKDTNLRYRRVSQTRDKILTVTNELQVNTEEISRSKQKQLLHCKSSKLLILNQDTFPIHVKCKERRNDISRCDALRRIIIVINKYNQWLESNNLIKDIDIELIDYNKYNNDSKRLINESVQSAQFVSQYSTELLLIDLDHIKYEHYYQYQDIHQFCIKNMDQQYEICDNHNCFNMKYYFFRNKQYRNTMHPLQILINLHLYIFHVINISQFKIQDIHPRNLYFITNYIEKQQRELKIQIYFNHNTIFPCNIIHLLSFYIGDILSNRNQTNTVSVLKLSQFIQITMNKPTLNKIWKKVEDDGYDTIDAQEIDGLLLLTVILMIATEFKESGSSKRPKIDKMALKKYVHPIAEWMKTHKMIKKPHVTKEEFKGIFSEWLKEYHHVTNGGIIADEQQQTKILTKYKLTTSHKVGNKLVFNCKHLKEYKSSKQL